MSRHLVESRVAAFAGGLWIGFAPGFVLHTNGQPNLACGFVVPFIVWQVIRLREPGRRWRGGALLGVLIAVQAFVGEEFLLLLAITLGFVAFFFAFSRPPVRDFLAGLLVAAGVAGVLLAYPLYWQFFGPGHYSGLPFRPDLYATPLGSIVAYPRGVLAGNDAIAKRVGGGSLTEDATLWGPAPASCSWFRWRCCGGRWRLGRWRSPVLSCWSCHSAAGCGSPRPPRSDRLRSAGWTGFPCSIW
ncbi:hypothetical protein [Paractinoplanes durhamensis]|uniref:hypothetical protein n=1 Tax=Paractinoplanes durhamensis TaxID=113563 RepID=UPI00363B3DF5